MGDQSRALVWVVAACALTLTGCSAAVGAAPEEVCDLPVSGTLDREDAGGYSFTYANGATARIAFANGSCVLDSNPFPIPREQRTEWELGFIYDYYRAELAPCLNGFGFPLLAPPDRAEFIARGGDWSPYDAVFTNMVSASTLGELSRVCPREPAGLP